MVHKMWERKLKQSGDNLSPDYIIIIKNMKWFNVHRKFKKQRGTWQYGDKKYILF